MSQGSKYNNRIMRLMGQIEDIHDKMFHEIYPETANAIHNYMVKNDENKLKYYHNQLAKLVDELNEGSVNV